MPLSLSASMTRWKPSVSSCCTSSVLEGVRLSLRAASAMGISLDLFRSIQIIGVCRHVLGKPERMIAHEVLRALGVALLDRLDDGHVVADGASGPILLANSLAPDHAHMGEQVFRQRDEHTIAAHADNALVKLYVDLGIF